MKYKELNGIERKYLVGQRKKYLNFLKHIKNIVPSTYGNIALNSLLKCLEDEINENITLNEIEDNLKSLGVLKKWG